MAAKLSESVENYLETIFVLKAKIPVVRVKDIGRKMRVSMPSVHTALHLLEDQALISHEKYGHVELTAKGAERAKTIYASHTLLVEFLTATLGVPAGTAEHDACKIEHVISPVTLQKITAFTRKSRP
jgi:DtxR family transcriptional regulator, Mn-dependent transcriptional regulator